LKEEILEGRLWRTRAVKCCETVEMIKEYLLSIFKIDMLRHG